MEGAGQINGNLILLFLGLIFAIICGFGCYLFFLQRRFYNGCEKEGQLTLFFNSPSGLPHGTVRSVIALMIISVCFIFMGLHTLLKLEYPETLTTILGTVLGFYFGNRGAFTGAPKLSGPETLSNEAPPKNTDFTDSRQQVVSLVDKALSSFSSALGPGLSAKDMISTLAAVSIQLSGTAYEMWKTRILHLPFPMKWMTLDNTDAGIGLLQKIPILSTAFGQYFQGQNQEFLTQVVTAFLGGNSPEKIFQGYGSFFDSPGSLEKGVEQFRQGVLDLKLASKIPAELTRSMGGFDAVMKALNRLHASLDAKKDLETLVTKIAEMKAKKEAAKQIFDQAMKKLAG